MPINDKIALEPSRGARVWGWGVVAATITLYVVFW